MAAVADRLEELRAQKAAIEEQERLLLEAATQEAELEKQLQERLPEIERMEAELAAQQEEADRIKAKLRELRGEDEKPRRGRPRGPRVQAQTSSAPSKVSAEDRPRREGSGIERLVAVLRRSANGELPLDVLTERMVKAGWDTNRANKANAVYTIAWEEMKRRAVPLVSKDEREGKIFISLTDAGRKAE